MAAMMRKTRSRLVYLLAVSVLCTLAWSVTLLSLEPQRPSHCSCHTCLQDDNTGFMKAAYHTPFLNKDFQASEEIFDWWKRIQGSKHDFDFFKMSLVKVFEKIPPVPYVLESSPDRCRTCAVVGNSGNLKGSYYGPLIDFHDIVIRMNRAPIQGYERDVGSRTTYHIMYPESAILVDNSTHVVFFPFKTQDFNWLLKAFNTTVRKHQMRANQDMTMLLNPAFMKYVHERWLQKKGSYPSTGFLTVILSLQMCDEVTVFGFGADSEGGWSHYFEKSRPGFRTGGHPGMYEYKILEQLEDYGKIVFFRGW